jgi:putative membrane protein
MEDPTLATATKKDPYKRIVILLSILIPLSVAVLFRVEVKGYDLTFLPPIYATINGVTAILLIAAVICIKNGRQRAHELIMKTCMGLSALFLLMYVAYHMTSASTPFGGTGYIRYIYFFILISHILLSVGVIPLVLFTYLRAWRGDYLGHRKLAKIAFPFWLYVAVSGVVVYLMISPYYK